MDRIVAPQSAYTNFLHRPEAGIIDRLACAETDHITEIPFACRSPSSLSLCDAGNTDAICADVMSNIVADESKTIGDAGLVHRISRIAGRPDRC